MTTFFIFSCSQRGVEEQRKTQSNENPTIIHLQKMNEIQLQIKDNIFLGRVKEMAVADSFILLYDDLVHQFNLSGEYVSRIGNKGRGPGEFDYIFSLEITSNGQIYFSDPVSSRLMKYHRNGEFLKSITTKKEILLRRVLVDEDFNLLKLVYYNNNFLLQKTDSTGKELYFTLPVVRNIDHAHVTRMFERYIGFCYNPISGKIYFKEPGSFQILEINSKGEIENIFGIEPPDFNEMKLPPGKQIVNVREFHKFFRNTTFSKRMSLIGNRFLTVDFQNAKRGSRRYFLVYDLDEDYKVFLIKNEIISTDLVTTSALGDKLYVYSPPDETQLETSNGRIDIFTLVFE